MRMRRIDICRIPTTAEEKAAWAAKKVADYVPLRTLYDVEVVSLGAFHNDFQASRDGIVVAKLQTFDDNPVSISEELIEVEGILRADSDGLESGYGSWRLWP